MKEVPSPRLQGWNTSPASRSEQSGFRLGGERLPPGMKLNTLDTHPDPRRELVRGSPEMSTYLPTCLKLCAVTSLAPSYFLIWSQLQATGLLAHRPSYHLDPLEDHKNINAACRSYF